LNVLKIIILMMIDYRNELLLVSVDCQEFTHQVVVNGTTELLRFIYSELMLPKDFDINDFLDEVKENINSDFPVVILGYELWIQVASSFSKSQILNYFEND